MMELIYVARDNIQGLHRQKHYRKKVGKGDYSLCGELVKVICQEIWLICSKHLFNVINLSSAQLWNHLFQRRMCRYHADGI